MRGVQTARAVLAPALVLGACASEGQPSATLRVEDAWVRFTPGGMGAAYFTVTGGAEDDRLTNVTTDAADHTELHTTILSGDVMQMRPADGLDVPAGQEVVMAPGGSHVMLFGVNSTTPEGSTVPLVLEFEGAGVIEVVAAVRGP